MLVRILLSLALLLVFAVVVRGLLGARQVTWPRLLLAALLGYVVGATVAGLLLVGPLEQTDLTEVEIDATELVLLAVPFQLLVTMAVVVVFEVVLARPRRRRLRPVNPVSALRRRVQIARRGLQVSRVAARTGLGPVLGLTRGRPTARDPGELARRAREAIEELGGVYVKLGQLLATRPDLLPPEAIGELGRLHSDAIPLPVAQVRAVLAAELGRAQGVLAEMDEQPLGSASIAQVHPARLVDGSDVVVKVQRPGLEDVLERDLAILDWVARTAERRTAWGRRYRARDLADDLADQLQTELDFRNEARFVADVAAGLVEAPQVHVPAVLGPTTPRVLITERLHGRPLAAGPAPPADAGALADVLCRAQVRAMMRGQRFHADPHPGNVLLLEDGRLGLVDFGMTGKLDTFGRAFVTEMLAAIRLQDPGLLYEALVTAGSVELGGDRDSIERELAAFMAAHLTSGLPSPEAMTELVRLTGVLGIAMPDQAVVMLRAVGTLAGTLETLSPGFPFLERVADEAGVEIRSRLAPTSAGELLQREWASLGPFLRRAPRHLDRIATQVEAGRLRAQVSLFSDPADRRVLRRLVDQVVLAVLGVGLLAVSVAMITVPAGPVLVVEDLRLLAVLGWVGLFTGSVLVLRVLLAAIRPDGDP